MVKDLKIEQIKNPITMAIGTACMIKGSGKLSGTDMKEISDYVSKTLKESFTTYRIPEVCQAIELGARGELFKENDMNTISPENIFKWIHRYNEMIRREAIDKQKKHEEKLDKEAAESLVKEKTKQFEDSILKLYKNFPIGFNIESKGTLAAMYRQLDKKGLIKMSVANKKNIYDSILKIKDRTKFSRKGFLELTAKELAEYRALRITFKEWKEFGYDLKNEINLNE